MTFSEYERSLEEKSKKLLQNLSLPTALYFEIVNMVNFIQLMEILVKFDKIFMAF